MIEFDGVSKAFVLHTPERLPAWQRLWRVVRPRGSGAQFWALRDLSFRVAPGESIGLVGSNGSGKSTTLKLITRILQPTCGAIRVQGRVAALLELGSGFHPELSGRENVFLYGSLMGLGRRDMAARLDEIVAFAEMERFIDTEVKHYSSGMYARLAFSVATAVDPDILITDEVLSVGDEAFRRKCEDRIAGFHRAGKTIMYVSHGLESVRQLCTRAIWLDQGVARAIGPTAEVIDAYLQEVNRREEAMLAERGGQLRAEGRELRRHGTREAEIVAVELLDGAGQPCVVARTHAALTIRMHYRAHQPVEHPVFGIGIHHPGGVWLSGPNTAFDGLTIPRISNAGVVDYHIPSLPLLTGHYQLSVALVDATMLHTYDMHDRRYTLVVQSDGLHDRYGTLALGGSWVWRG